MKNGNALGGCGQIQDDLKDIIPAEGWTREMINGLFQTWERWHLNDMRPGCQHQTGPAWEYHNVTVTYYSLNWDNYYHLKKEIESEVYNFKTHPGLEAASQIFYAAKILQDCFDLGLGCFSKTALQPGMIDNYPFLVEYLEHHPEALKVETESKGTGWLYESEHPEGILMKACPICGYKYGSAWNKEEVPADVINWLFSLPATDITPAWV